jgi:hypothetical protein
MKTQQPTRDHRIGGLLKEVLQMMIMSVPVCHKGDGGAVWRSREVFRVVSCVNFFGCISHKSNEFSKEAILTNQGN